MENVSNLGHAHSETLDRWENILKDAGYAASLVN